LVENIKSASRKGAKMQRKNSQEKILLFLAVFASLREAAVVF
jgi:hypothetical protein